MGRSGIKEAEAVSHKDPRYCTIEVGLNKPTTDSRCYNLVSIQRRLFATFQLSLVVIREDIGQNAGVIDF